MANGHSNKKLKCDSFLEVTICITEQAAIPNTRNQNIQHTVLSTTEHNNSIISLFCYSKTKMS